MTIDTLMEELRVGNAACCSNCPRVPIGNDRVFAKPCGEHWAVSEVSVAFILESPDTAPGGPPETGVICAYHNTDGTAKIIRQLMDKYGLTPFTNRIYFTNAILHGGTESLAKTANRHCYKALRLQLDIIKPKVIVAFGVTAQGAVEKAYDTRLDRTWCSRIDLSKTGGPIVFLVNHPRRQSWETLHQQWAFFAPEVLANITMIPLVKSSI